MTTTIDPALGNGPWTQQGVGTTPGYDAIDVRRLATDPDLGEGVTTYGSFRVSQKSSGAAMSVDINMDDAAYVRGDAVTLQGLYKVAPHSSTINETITTADGSNPRIDRVVLEIKDNQHDSSGSNLAQVRVIAGTATSGATLDNLTGAASVPASALLLADVLVAASDTSISDSEIRDRRAFVAGIPPLITNVDMVAFVSPVTLAGPNVTTDLSSNHDLLQAAALAYLPRRIVGATRIRWAYLQHTSTALAGTYNIGIYDASGRTIISTGATSFAGAALSRQVKSDTITATTFEAGWYYVVFGSDTSTGSAGYHGWGAQSLVPSGGSSTISAPFPNALLGLGSGGTTLPTTLLGFTDTSASDLSAPKVPQIALSVG